MSSDSLQYAASPEQRDVFGTGDGNVLVHDSDVDHESDVDRANEDFEIESSDSESDNSDLAELPSSLNVFGTSVPSAGFFTPSSAQHHNASYALVSMRSAISSFETRQSFATAQSSLASYVTASNSPRRRWVGLTQPTDEVSPGTITNLRFSYSHDIARQELRDLVDAIETRLLRRTDAVLLFGRPRENILLLKGYILETLDRRLGLGVPVTSLDPSIQSVITNIESWNDNKYDIAVSNIRLDVTVEIYMYALKTHYLKHLVPNGIFTDGQMSKSEWILHLHSRGILPDEAHGLDWSGRGQHTEYLPGEESLIPLAEGKVLGYSKTAVVQSVRCRRIQLARKTIQCNRKSTKEMAVTEVEHLQRAQHRHVVRVVGTYTLRKSLAILLYPAAKWNLDDFLDELSDQRPPPFQFAHALQTFFGCLANAIRFIHNRNIKHMDIKPKNILVHVVRGRYQVFIADFGIARAYASAEESNTDSPTSFTPIYAAPEVAAQSLRGFSADIFSLGCVFLEILVVLSSTQRFNYRVILSEVRHGKSYEASLVFIQSFYDAHTDRFLDAVHGRGPRNKMQIAQMVATCRRMLDGNPDSRPDAWDLSKSFRHFSCGGCEDGPEPFVAADEESMEVSIDYNGEREC
jgi:serine/threonine protein kinase